MHPYSLHINKQANYQYLHCQLFLSINPTFSRYTQNMHMLNAAEKSKKTE